MDLFDNITGKELIKAAGDIEDAPGADINRKLYDGDHWLGGSGWIGPHVDARGSSYGTINTEIKKVFTSANVIKEVVDRCVDGVLGRVPHISITSDNQELAQEALSLVMAFWNKRNNMRLLKEVMGRQKLGEKVCVRYYVPSGLLINSSGVDAFPEGTIEECLNKIYAHVTVPGSAKVTTDDITQREVAVYTEKTDDNKFAEVQYIDSETGDTVVRYMDGDDEEAFSYNLGGLLMIYQSNIRNIISEQVRQNQYAINLAKTMAAHNTIAAGFLERIILNGMPPGEFVENPNTGEKEFVPHEFKVGAGTTNFYNGPESIDDNGRVTRSNVGVVFRDPVSNEVFTDSKRDLYRDILEEVSQSHILISGDSTASGVSRVQARSAFNKQLQDDKAELDLLCEWLVKTPLAMASYFAGEPGRYAGISVSVSCYVDTGELSAEERKAIVNEWNAGLLSTERVMSMLGTEDVENNIIAVSADMEQGKSSIDLIERRVNVYKSLIDTGLSAEEAKEISGINRT